MQATVRGWTAAGLVVAGLGVAGTAQAVALINLGTGIIRDPSTNLEWLANANLAASNAFGVSGISGGSMTWTTAQTWIAAMNAAGYLGGGWRLPQTAQPDTTCSTNVTIPGFPTQYYGYNCTGSEMGDLFYNKLGGDAGQSVLATTGDTFEEIANLLLFGGSVGSSGVVTGSTIQSFVYWSDTEFAPQLASAWAFRTFEGYQDPDQKSVTRFAWAVRPGQAAVPEPASLLLLGASLAGIGWGRRRARRPG